jgi:prophage tail gpP-like protein
MLKVAKKRSDIVSRLNTMGACYVSKNTVDGKEDSLKLFPDDYNVEEEVENESCENESKKKKKKRRKKREKDGEESQSATGDQVSTQDSEDTLDGELPAIIESKPGMKPDLVHRFEC